MAKLTDNDKLKILADWKAGISQNQLSKNYSLSPATINKICKGIEQSNVQIVNAKIAIATELQNKNEYEVNSIERIVNDELRRKNLVYGVQEKAIKKAETMLDQIDTPLDLKNIVDAVDKASLTLGVNQRHSNQNINVQTNTAMQTNTEITHQVVKETLESFNDEY